MLSLALVFGCTTESPTTVSTGADAIPDPYGPLHRASCEGSGVVENTGTAWFVGDVLITGSSFTGTETAAVHWSPKFVSECGYLTDCRIPWRLSGSIVAAGACVDCEFAFQIAAVLDPTAADCPPERLTDFELAEWSATWDVLRSDDGTTDLFESDTGASVGGWYWAGSRVTWVAKAALCSPYADDLSTVCGG